MATRRTGKLLAVAAAGSLVLSTGAVSATAQTPAAEEVTAVTAEAAGVLGHTDQLFEGAATHTDFHFFSDVSLPPEGGGPLHKDLPARSVMFQNLFELPVTSGMEVSVEGALGEDGFATASASLTSIFSDAGVFGEILQADLVEVECLADQNGAPSASTTIQGGTTQDLSAGATVAIPEFPEPDTVLVDFEHEEAIENGLQIITAYIVANEQMVSDGELTATGLRVDIEVETIPDEGDPESIGVGLSLGALRCGVESGAAEPEPDPEPEPDVVAEPRFTG